MTDTTVIRPVRPVVGGWDGVGPEEARAVVVVAPTDRVPGALIHGLPPQSGPGHWGRDYSVGRQRMSRPQTRVRLHRESLPSHRPPTLA